LVVGTGGILIKGRAQRRTIVLSELATVMPTPTKLVVPRTDGGRAEEPALKSKAGNKLFDNGLPEAPSISFRSLRHTDRGTA
jgi:hypothetical protein